MCLPIFFSVELERFYCAFLILNCDWLQLNCQLFKHNGTFIPAWRTYLLEKALPPRNLFDNILTYLKLYSNLLHVIVSQCYNIVPLILQKLLLCVFYICMCACLIPISMYSYSCFIFNSVNIIIGLCLMALHPLHRAGFKILIYFFNFVL